MLKALLKFAIIAAVTSVVDLFGAQIAVWGLDYMHVHTGLIGPYLILAAIGFIVSMTIVIQDAA